MRRFRSRSINIRRGLFTAVVVLVLPSVCFGYSGGSGEPNDPYQIADVNDLMALAGNVNDYNKCFILTADINMAGLVFATAVIAPDTNNTTWDFEGTPFTGTFDGSNHTIYNLTIDTADANNYYLGLFGQIRSSAVINNLRLEDVNISSGNLSDYVGGLCGINGDWDYAGGTISNCYSESYIVCGSSSDTLGGLVGLNHGTISNSSATGSISGGDYFGGLAGWNFYGSINNCYADGYVSAGYFNSYAVGGLVGCNEGGTINECHTNSYVTGEDGSYAFGGLVGEMEEGDINNCYSTGTVNADEAIGSLVGRNYYGGISNCYSAGTVIGRRYTIGGLIGYNYHGTISNCCAKDSVTGDANSDGLGGLAGWNYGIISNCYSTSIIAGGNNSYNIGGLVGYNQLTISDCYAAGVVSGGADSNNLAGLCGCQHGYYAEISNCFWDTESTGMSIGCNFDETYPGPGTVTNLFGKTTAEMQIQSTFTDYGWDFVDETINGPNDIWDICDGTNYPKLSWQIPPVGDFVCPDGVDFIDYAFFAEHWMQTIYGDCGGVELTGDGKVNGVDFALFAEYWMLTSCGECGGADLTGDENVDMADLYVFAAHWLETEYAEVDLTSDGQVGLDDLREFAENWLAGIYN